MVLGLYLRLCCCQSVEQSVLTDMIVLLSSLDNSDKRTYHCTITIGGSIWNVYLSSSLVVLLVSS